MKSLILFLISCLSGTAVMAEAEMYLPQPFDGEKNGIMMHYRLLEEAELEWQFSLDGGENWRPMIPRIGAPLPVEKLSGYFNRLARLALPGGYISGLSFRAKLEFNDGTKQLSEVVSIPHVDVFPVAERLFEMDHSAYNRMEADSGLICFRVFDTETGTFNFQTYSEQATVWSRGVDLKPPSDTSGFCLLNGQLFISAPDGETPNPGVQIYDWQNTELQWSPSQYILSKDEFGVEQIRIVRGIALSDDRLFVSYSDGGGYVNFYEKQPSGLWEYVASLKPSGPGNWEQANKSPISFGDTIVTHGKYGEGKLSAFSFRKQPDGEWLYVGGEEVQYDKVFKAEDYILRVYYPFYHLEDTRKERLTLVDPSLPNGDNLVSTTLFDYGFFPSTVEDGWMLLGFEPSPENWVSTGAVAISPVLGEQIHPKPALLVPENLENYSYVGAVVAISGSQLISVSQMNDGTSVVDAIDLSAIPHPKFPDVSFAKWTAIGEIPVGDFVIPLFFRESAIGTSKTKVMFSYDKENWFEVPESEVYTNLVESDVDGDGRVNLVRIKLPIQRNGRTVFYRLEEFGATWGSGG